MKVSELAFLHIEIDINMFEGEWNNFDPGKLPELPVYYPDVLHDYLESSVYFVPENVFELPFFPAHREDDAKDNLCYLPLTSEWQSGLELPSAGASAAVERDRTRMPFTPSTGEKSGKLIGPLTVEERQVKIQRYLDKRQRRNFHKKVVYLCRKRVADTRLRVKGRFVAKQLAESLHEEKDTEAPGFNSAETS